MPEGESSLPIEHEIAAHLGEVELLRMPHPPAQDEPDVAPDHARRRDGHETPSRETESPIAEPVRVGEPEKWMPKVLGKALEVVGLGKRDHRDLAMPRRNLLVKLPQLREVLLAVESTEVAEHDQNRGAAEQLPPMEDPALKRHEIEVEIDPHRIIMLPLRCGSVTGITAGAGFDI